MPLNNTYADLAMDQTRLPREAAPVTSTMAQALKDGKVLADDGNAYDTVQGAQDAASSWILLPPATFNESVTVDTAGLTVVGSGYDTLIDGGTSGNAIKITASDVTVRDLSVQTTAGGGNFYHGITVTTGDGATIKGVTARDSDAYGIQIKAVDVTVSEYRVETADRVGIEFASGGTRGILSDAIITSTGEDGIQTGDDDITISGVVITGAGQHGMTIQGNDAVVGGCRVHNSSDDGIHISGTDNIICNNRISGSTNSDIDDSGTNTLQSDNKTGAAN